MSMNARVGGTTYLIRTRQQSSLTDQCDAITELSVWPAKEAGLLNPPSSHARQDCSTKRVRSSIAYLTRRLVYT